MFFLILVCRTAGIQACRCRKSSHKYSIFVSLYLLRIIYILCFQQQILIENTPYCLLVFAEYIHNTQPILHRKHSFVNVSGTVFFHLLPTLHHRAITTSLISICHNIQVFEYLLSICCISLPQPGLIF